MLDKLKVIEESFEILQDEENEINNKTLKTDEDIRNLEAIKKLREELIEQRKKLNIAVQEQEDKLTKNKTRLEEIEYASKKLYPKLEGKDKTRKKEILENLGFVSTLGFDGREVFVERSLIDEYNNLVKETKPLVEEQKRQYFKARDKKENTNLTMNSLATEELTTPENEENFIITEELSLEERIKQIEEKIEKLLSERDLANQGKKDAITYKGDKYWIPRKRKGEFKTLMTQLNSLKKKQREQEAINLESISNERPDVVINGLSPLPTPFTYDLDSSLSYDPDRIIPSSYVQGKTLQIPTQTLDERIDDIKKKIELLLTVQNESKKDMVEVIYEGKKYEISKYKLPNFYYLMSELYDSILEKEQDKTDSTIDDYLNGIVSGSIAAATQTSEIQPENGQNQNVPTQLEGADNSSSQDKEEDDLVNRIMKGVQNQINSTQNGVSTTTEGNEIIQIPSENQESEQPTVEQGTELEITGVRKPKVVEKIKDWFKSNKEKVKKAIVGVVIAGLAIAAALGLKGCAPKKETPTQEPIKPDTSYADDELIDEMASGPNQIAIDLMEENPYLEHRNEQMMEELGFEEELIGPEISEDKGEENDYSETYNESEKDILIGSSVIVDEATPIYATATDSIFKTNAYRPYYDNNIERVTLGVSIEYNGKIINVLANTENYNETIKNMLNDGGKILSVLTANKANVPVNFDGTTTLTAAQINEMAEGFYPAENINLNNTYERGMSR